MAPRKDCEGCAGNVLRGAGLSLRSIRSSGLRARTMEANTAIRRTRTVRRTVRVPVKTTVRVMTRVRTVRTIRRIR